MCCWTNEAWLDIKYGFNRVAILLAGDGMFKPGDKDFSLSCQSIIIDKPLDRHNYSNN
jgi:hypothetical protein